MGNPRNGVLYRANVCVIQDQHSINRPAQKPHGLSLDFPPRWTTDVENQRSGRAVFEATQTLALHLAFDRLSGPKHGEEDRAANGFPTPSPRHRTRRSPGSRRILHGPAGRRRTERLVGRPGGRAQAQFVAAGFVFGGLAAFFQFLDERLNVALAQPIFPRVVPQGRRLLWRSAPSHLQRKRRHFAPRHRSEPSLRLRKRRPYATAMLSQAGGASSLYSASFSPVWAEASHKTPPIRPS